MPRKCEQCGNDIVDRGKYAKFCSDCSLHKIKYMPSPKQIAYMKRKIRRENAAKNTGMEAIPHEPRVYRVSPMNNDVGE